MKNILIITTFLISISITTFCAEKNKLENKNTQNVELFDVFYERFLSDKDFQLERINFPIRGRYMDNDLAGTVESDSIIWTKENWSLIKKIDKKDLKDIKISKNISENEVIIKTEGVNENFITIETYKKIDDKWFLIEYVDLSM